MVRQKHMAHPVVFRPERGLHPSQNLTRIGYQAHYHPSVDRWQHGNPYHVGHLDNLSALTHGCSPFTPLMVINVSRLLLPMIFPCVYPANCGMSKAWSKWLWL